MSLVIPARPGQEEVPAVTAAQALDYPGERLEIIVARGRQPSVQRNQAVAEAEGELIYFLDDDSQPLPGNLRCAVAHFADNRVQMVGGPNVCPPDAPMLERVFATVLASWIASGPSRARYAPVGRCRPATEKELILCNLVARRSGFEMAGGFDELLYPNEENALMDDLQQKGGVLLYDPAFVVYRRPRSNLRAFIKMLLNYGRGRAEQFRLHPTPGSTLNFVPPLFCVYLAALPVLWRVMSELAVLPLAIYGLTIAAQTVYSSFSKGLRLSLLALPLLLVTHVFYGLGFWWGLFTRPQRAREPGQFRVELERINV